MYTGFWWGNLRQRDHLEDIGIDGRRILILIFRKWNIIGVWPGSSWLRLGTGGGQSGNEPSGFITCGEFLD